MATAYPRCDATTTAEDVVHRCYLTADHHGDHVCQGEAGARVGCYLRWPPPMTADEARRICIAQAVRAIEQADTTGDPLMALIDLHSLLRSSDWADLQGEL